MKRAISCMGTVFSFDVRTAGVDPGALDRAEAWLHATDATYSVYRTDSAVSRLDRGELAEAEISAELRHVLACCEQLRDRTDGFFDARAGGRLDVSGFVKGWAVERVSTMLARAGSRSHCVNGGGDVQCVGDAGGGRPWRIGIADPRTPGRLAATVAGTGIAVATSGNAERGDHVLDPHTSRPPRGLASVTVVGPHLTDADAYATAAFARGSGSGSGGDGGADGAAAWLGTLAGYSALIVSADGSLTTTGALRLPT